MIYAAAVIYAGFISMDRFAAFSIMLSRPIVIALLLGLLFGNSAECFYAGIIFEAVGIMDVPFGTRVPKEDSFAAFATCSLLTIVPCSHLPQFILLFLLSLLMMYPVTLTLYITRALNKALYVRQIDKGRVYPIRLLTMGAVFSFLRGAIFYSLGTLLIYEIYNLIQSHVETSMNYYLMAMMTFAFLSGYILRFLSARTYMKYAVFMLGLFIGWLML